MHKVAHYNHRHSMGLGVLGATFWKLASKLDVLRSHSASTCTLCRSATIRNIWLSVQGMAFPEQPGHPGTTLLITADLLRNGYPPEALPAHAGGNFVALLPCTSQPGTNGSADGTDAGWVCYGHR